MKKKLLCMGLITSFLLLSACDSHSHTAAGEWTAELETHHQVCECGEMIEQAHALQDGICAICGSEVVMHGDGSLQLITYNSYGDCTQSIVYAADGTVEYEDTFEYTYDGAGNMLGQKNYNGGTLMHDFSYALNENGELYTVKEIYYFDDGTWSVNEYDETGRMLSSCTYLADENTAHRITYTYSADGSMMTEKDYTDEMLISEQEYLLGEDDSQTVVRERFYNEDGSYLLVEYDAFGNETREASCMPDGTVEIELRYENEYNSDGDRILCRTYENDVLVEEMEYIYVSDADGSWSMNGKTTSYHADGSKTVKDSDLESRWSTEITYDPSGKVIEEIRYEYDMEDGISTGSRGYRNGKLFHEVRTIKNADGELIVIEMIDYHEDGSWTVSEYDDMFELIKTTNYHADGSVA